jgi:nucleotide-binding universal stress UspA family protein
MIPAMMTAPVPVDFAEDARQEALAEAEKAAAKFAELARVQGVRAETRVTEVLMGGAPESFLNRCRLTDLIVIGQEDRDTPEPMRETITEAALMEGCAPLLVVPYILKGAVTFDRIMIAWDGSRTAARAVRAAMPVLELAKEIGVVMVGTALDQPGEPGSDVASWLARHGLAVTVEQVPGPETSVAAALLNHASDKGYDLVVMGGYGHSRMREFFFGGATAEILSTMTVPVIMVH